MGNRLYSLVLPLFAALIFASSSFVDNKNSFDYKSRSKAEEAAMKGKRKHTPLRVNGELHMPPSLFGKRILDVYGETTGFKDAYLWWYEERAYPFGKLDFSIFEKAQRHVEKMEPARSPSASVRAAGGSKWESLGPKGLDIPYQIYYGQPPLSGRVNDVAAVPGNPDMFYIATATGGVWRIERLGPTNFNATPLSDDWESMATNAVAIDPMNPDVIYVGTGDFNGGYPYSFGIMKSVDGGNTWQNYGRSQFGSCAVRRILIDPDNPNIIVVAAGRGQQGTTGLWRSTDGGLNWSLVLNVNAAWTDVEASIPDGSGNRIYYASGEGVARLYRSHDRGATWVQMSSPVGNDWVDGVEIAASATDPNRVYYLVGAYGQIFRSNNQGQSGSWTDISAGFPNGSQFYNWSQWWYDFHINCTANPANGQDLVFVGLIDIVMSQNNGSGWQSVGLTYTNNAITHNDQHGIAFNPAIGNNVEALVANDGGIHILNYNAQSNTWTFNPHANDKIVSTQFYRFDIHPTDSTRVLGGTQDNATPWSNGTLNTWKNVGGGDGGFCAINPSNPANQYATSQFLAVYRTNNSWSSSSYIGPNYGGDNVAFIAPITIDPSNPHLLYAGTNYLYRWNNNTNSWESRLGNQSLGSSIRAIAVAPSNSNVIYTGSTNGVLYMTTNAGVSYTQINSGANNLPNRTITSIAVNPNNAFDIIVTLSGTNVGHVWRCSDVQPNDRLWVDISGTGGGALPDVPTTSVIRHPSAPSETYFVANDAGLFFTTNSGTTWINATSPLGMPRVDVSELRFAPAQDKLFAATWGRGIWMLDLNDVGLNKLVANPKVYIGDQTGSATLEVDRPTGTSGVNVALSSSNPAILQVPAFTTIPAGKREVTFNFTTVSPTNGPEVITITASTSSGQVTETVIVYPLMPVQLILTPPSVTGGNSVTGTLKLNGPAGTGGLQVDITSSDSTLAQPDVASVLVPQGESEATFTITTYGVKATTKVRISATANGGTARATLEITPPVAKQLILNPQQVFSGETCTGTVVISGPAPEGGTVVKLKSGIPALVQVPDEVVVPQGSSSVDFIITTASTNSLKAVSIFATRFETVSNVLIVKPPVPTSFVVVPSTIKGGQNATATVVINSAAPANYSFDAFSDKTSVATVPAKVVVPQGQTTVNFTVQTKAVSQPTIVTLTVSKAGVKLNFQIQVVP